MNEQQAKQFIENWVRENKYTVEWKGNNGGEGKPYKTKAEAFADTNFIGFSAGDFDIPKNTERGEFYATVEIRVFNKIAKEDYEKILNALCEDDKDTAIDLLIDSSFTDGTRLVTKGAFISDDWNEEEKSFKLKVKVGKGTWYGTRAFPVEEYIYFSPLPGNTLNIVGRITTPNAELPLELKDKNGDYDFEFVLPEFTNDEELGNIITGKIDEHLGGSYSYDYDVFLNGQKIIIEAE